MLVTVFLCFFFFFFFLSEHAHGHVFIMHFFVTIAVCFVYTTLALMWNGEERDVSDGKKNGIGILHSKFCFFPAAVMDKFSPSLG